MTENNYNQESNLPAAPKVEEAVMGLAITYPIDVMDAITEQIGDGAFHGYHTRTVYETMREMERKEITVNSVTISQYLIDHSGLDQETIRNITIDMLDWTESVYSLQALPQYIQTLRDKKMRRDALAAADTIQRLAYDADFTAAEILNQAQASLFEVQASDSKGLKHIAPNVKNAIHTIQEAHRHRGKVTHGLSTGFIELDRMLMGLKPGDLFYLAARPSMGKTALVMNIAMRVALEQKIPVDVFSLEMSADQLTTRLVCSKSGINLQRVRDGFLSKEEMRLLMQGSKDLTTSQIYIDDTSQITIAELRARARRAKLHRNTGLIVVDYLQLMKGVSKQAQVSREREISEISAGLKSLAKELQVPVVCLAQLNRSVDERRDKIPMLSDLRESGSIEQDADIVGFITRKFPYTKDEEDKNDATFILGKQRNGPIGQFPLFFDGATTTFSNPTGQDNMFGKNSEKPY